MAIDNGAEQQLGRDAVSAMRVVAEAVTLARAAERDVATGAMSKGDTSPVTVLDFSVQALVASRLARSHPSDALVAEEDATALRGAPGLSNRVVELVRRADAGLDPEQILDLIDRGTASPAGRFWVLDPIDGTKGLLRGGQYAIALALIVDGLVGLGVLGCPRLSVDGLVPNGPPDASGGGGIAVAVRGRGAWWLPDADGPLRRLVVSAVSAPKQARVLHSLEASHGDVEALRRVIEALGMEHPPWQMDSQVKHAVIASGTADVLLRFPSRPDFHDAIWDQAAGFLLVEEAGGRVTDLAGRPLDFSAGRRLFSNSGVVATNGILHDAVLDATRRAEPARGITPCWEHFSHDADIGLVGLGPTKAEAFRQAAMALTAVVTDPGRVKTAASIAVVCHADNDELLLVEWLNTLVYEMAVRSMLFGDFSVEIVGRGLHATARGEPVDLERHQPAVEVKGATMTALRVSQVAGGWRAQCVVDV
jgi:3'(2'), 5'-bisphosphate nucleotidase